MATRLTRLYRSTVVLRKRAVVCVGLVHCSNAARRRRRALVRAIWTSPLPTRAAKCSAGPTAPTLITHAIRFTSLRPPMVRFAWTIKKKYNRAECVCMYFIFRVLHTNCRVAANESSSILFDRRQHWLCAVARTDG